MHLLSHGLPHGVPVMQVFPQSHLLNLRGAGQARTHGMWALPKLWMSGSAAKTPFRCTTPWECLIPSLHGHHLGAARPSIKRSPAQEPLTWLSHLTPQVAQLFEVSIHTPFGPMTFWTCSTRKGGRRLMKRVQLSSSHLTSSIMLDILIMTILDFAL